MGKKTKHLNSLTSYNTITSFSQEEVSNSNYLKKRWLGIIHCRPVKPLPLGSHYKIVRKVYKVVVVVYWMELKEIEVANES